MPTKQNGAADTGAVSRSLREAELGLPRHPHARRLTASHAPLGQLRRRACVGQLGPGPPERSQHAGAPPRGYLHD